MSRRLVALFLALLLPLQFAWSAAGAHCQHERSDRAAHHFGHHAHVHDGASEKPAAGPMSADSDCGQCSAVTPHAVADLRIELPALAPVSQLPEPPLRSVRSAPARAPDRPQWRRLA